MTQATVNKGKKRNTKTATSHAAPWSVRGVSHEARNAANLAARRAGQSIGEWIEGTIMVAAHEALKGPSVPAPTTEDTLKAILSQLEKRDAAFAEIDARMKAMEQSKGGWLARIFGRP